MVWYEPGWKLAGLLETIIQNYEEDREKYWSDDEQTVKLRQFIDSVASTIVESSDDMVLTLSDELSSTNWESAQALIEALELSSEVRAKAEILLAWRFAATTDQMAERCLELAEILLEQHPSERVLRFMRRLGRCYVAGFMPESIMVSRSVLENVVNEAVARRALRTDGKMSSKLDALLADSGLSSEARAEAWTVWQRGNTAIHKDPESVGQPLETIRMVLRVLIELQDS